MTKNPPLLAWHYTTADRLDSIERAGFILPATANVPQHERPVVWFSLHQHFEPTAIKGMIDSETGQYRSATLHEMIELSGGLVRFGLPPRALLTGEALRRAARINAQTWRGLAAAGVKSGGNPSQWFGHVGPIAYSDCTLQRMSSDMTWTSAA